MAVPVHSSQGWHEIRAQVVKTPVLVKGQRTPVVVRLTYAEDGMPVANGDFGIVRAPVIPVLINEPRLSDYRFDHLIPTNETPGEYVFFLTPGTACGYRVWADVTPEGGPPAYAAADIPGRQDCRSLEPETFVNTEVKNAGYTFTLSMEPPHPVRGRTATLKITVKDKDGRPVEELQPVMDAFAHMAVFYGDFQTARVVPPAGEDPADPNDLGGPDVTFSFAPERAGYLRLFSNFRIGGQVIAVPFGITVEGK